MRIIVTKFSMVFGLILIMFSHVAFAQQQEFGVDQRFLYVQPGQTLMNIMRKLYPEERKRWQQLINEIVRTNPDAFDNGDPRTLKVGARLQLPSKKLDTKPVPKSEPLEEVGSVWGYQGTPYAENDRTGRRLLTQSSKVFLGDRLMTGEDDFLHLRMIDDAELELRCNSEMLIVDYHLGARNRSELSLMKGSLHKITGRIGQHPNDRYVLSTPVATVGVRGTEYGIRVFQSEGCGGSADAPDDGLYLAVLEGEVGVFNNQGNLQLHAGEAAYVSPAQAQPQLVDDQPGVVFGQAEPEPVVEAKVEEPPPAVETAPVAVESEAEEDNGDWPFWWLVAAGVLLIIGL